MKTMIPALAGIVLASLAAGVFLLLRANLDVGAVVWAFFGLFAGILVPLVWFLVFAFMGRISR